MYTVLLVINIVSAIVMVGVILLQHGRGAEMGASFGRGSQGSLVGISGSTNFLSKTTSLLAIIFFATALALSVVAQQQDNSQILEQLEASEATLPGLEETNVSEIPQSQVDLEETTTNE